jgi:hypothetical protein
MKTVAKTRIYNAIPALVFDCLDNAAVSGAHMTKPFLPLIGTIQDLEFLTLYKSGFNTRYRWTGKFMKQDIDFTMLVSNWVHGKKKTWETIGASKMVIYSWFKMDLRVEPTEGGSIAHLSVTYKEPKGPLNKALCFLFGKRYCNWCIDEMLKEGEERVAAEKLELREILQGIRPAYAAAEVI